MLTDADIIIDGLGGTSAVAKMVKSPTSTVHSWRKNGIPDARLDHMKLAAKKARKPWPVIARKRTPDRRSEDAKPTALVPQAEAL
ncbi:hypothetical protein TomMM35A_18240 [Sphingobium sp. TomMM35A]